MGEAPKIPPELATRLRTLGHELTNAIESITQAAYLLGHAKLDEDSRKLAALVREAAQRSARIQREFRDIVRSQSE
jgi:nitrogen-specific signal transduction histidine kinase